VTAGTDTRKDRGTLSHSCKRRKGRKEMLNKEVPANRRCHQDTFSQCPQKRSSERLIVFGSGSVAIQARKGKQSLVYPETDIFQRRRKIVHLSTRFGDQRILCTLESIVLPGSPDPSEREFACPPQAQAWCSPNERSVVFTIN